MSLLKKTAVPTEEERPRGTWENDSTMDDAQAHRDRTYHIRSSIQQTFSIYLTQMALFSKRKLIYVMLIIAVLIPIIYVLIRDKLNLNLGNVTELSGSGIMGLLLFMFPFLLSICASFLMGSLMPKEFSERSAYMNMALPMSRWAFCLGKYLAGVTIIIGIFVFAYGMAMATAMMDYEYFNGEALAKSMILMLLAILVYTSFAFTMGCVIGRGAGILSFLLFLLVLPMIEFYLGINGNIQMSDLIYMPNLLPDFTCMALGSNGAASSIGFINMIQPQGIDVDDFSMTSIIVSIVWTIGFLLLGMIAVNRREM